MPPRRIVIFGSSTIYGTADKDCGGFVNRLRLWRESIDARNRVYNLGIWGEQTPNLIQRLPLEAAARRPHLIMAYPGFNDSRRDGRRDAPNAVSLGQFRVMMEELISSAKAISETVVMTGIPFDESRTTPLSGTDSYYLLHDAEAYSNELVSVARAQGARILDFFSILQNEDMSPLLADDGLHGNAKCHERLFHMTREFMMSEFSISA
ncbi:MAG: SGNH/GDSL hydrolase family protein [Methylocystis sp.]|uniref:SGNH/GDSL hydrolase family protein n=1 Tax=Methylocystis sp. TaxID=1911079 RepID=UPI003D0CB235